MLAAREFTSVPINRGSAQKISNGTSANVMPADSTTWLRISARDAFAMPQPLARRPGSSAPIARSRTRHQTLRFNRSGVRQLQEEREYVQDVEETERGPGGPAGPIQPHDAEKAQDEAPDRRPAREVSPQVSSERQKAERGGHDAHHLTDQAAVSDIGGL